MYASDYGFATSGGETANRNNCLDKELYYWNELEDCHKKNWLFGQQWLITSRSDLKSYVFTIDYNGARSSKLINETFKIKPVVYLKSNVLITSGNGSKENPFKIAL